MASSDFCTCKCATKRQSVSHQWHLSQGVSALQGFWFSPGGPWQELVKAEGWSHRPLPLHIPCPRLASRRSQQFQRKAKLQCHFTASISHHWVKLWRRKHTLGSDSVPEEKAMRDSFGECFQNFLAQHTWGGHTDWYGFGEARVIVILHLEGGISHHQPNLPLLWSKQTV